MLLSVPDHCFGLLDLVCGAGLLSPTSLPLELSRTVRGCCQGAAPAQRIGHVACAEGSSLVLDYESHYKCRRGPTIWELL